MKTPAQDKRVAAEKRERLRGLKPEQAEQLRRALRALESGDRLMATQWLFVLAREAPEHAEVLRARGLVHGADGEWPEAAACLARSAVLRPNDFGLLLALGAAQHDAGHADADAAPGSLRAAAACASTAAQWLALSVEFDRQAHFEDALAAAEGALRLDPALAVGLLQRLRCRTALGMAEAAAADCRALIARGQLTARAWFSLVDLKTVRLSDAELAGLEAAARAPALPAGDRLLLDFALGKALEDAGRPEQAFAVFARANSAARAEYPWDAPAFSHHVAAVRSAFEDGPVAVAQGQGSEVIFLVGLPRSGTTLVEQVLASHSQVEGASELPYLAKVIEDESQRRRQPFPSWVGRATAADWTRLGQDYLRLSARWRTNRAVSTDKLPGNWLLAGAALAMLPGARVIDCRRDPTETCWSCYKQLFGPKQAAFAYGLDTLASYWRDYDRLCRYWALRHPRQFQAQHYAALVSDPDGQIRALLDFCGLPFEPACLEFHKTQRAIRTPSALQVRQPLLRSSTPAVGYGALLDTLRLALGDGAG